MFSLPRVIVILSLVSFFNDIASDMVIPLIPVLLSSLGSGGAVLLGVVEGVADAVASALRLWSGRLSDRTGSRKTLALWGYALSNAVRPLLGCAGNGAAWVGLRALDRVGKGLRSAPRDALIVDSVSKDMRGRAFGLHRAFDNFGAVLGAILAAYLIAGCGLGVTEVIYVSAIPGFLTVLLLYFGVKESRTRVESSGIDIPVIESGFLSRHRLLTRYLLVLFVFTLSKASETFIVLRGSELGLSAPWLLALWAGMNATKALTAYLGGHGADRLGHRGILRLSWTGAVLSSVLLSLSPSGLYLALAALFMCLPSGLGEGAERAYIADLSHAGERGSAYGWYNLATGVAAIPGGLLFGGLWAISGAPTAFLVSALLASAALLGLGFWVPKGKH